MATPTYTKGPRERIRSHAGRNPGGKNHRWFGGHTPPYAGSGQPDQEHGGSIFGSQAPAYMSAPTQGTQTEKAKATAPQADALAIAVKPSEVARQQ
jgi:hypothetical protein